jgi:alkanesulfonate monooxygenase SsuD/methylene tetrahydromethanopterin reductase-like flavin-dependent oxidoreductase (luciferase family)
MVSYGVVLPTRGSVLESDDAAALTARTDRDVLGLAVAAEAGGFDSVWVGDSVVAKPRHEPLTTLGAVAGATDAVGLGTAVYLPALRDAVHVAHATATLDHLSAGRFAFGVGAGPVESDYTAIGRPWTDRGRALDETLDVVTALWTGEPVSYDGDHVQYDGVGLGFSAAGPPPVLVASGVHPQKGIIRPIRQRMVAHGDGWLPANATPEAVEYGRRQLEADVEASDREADFEVWFYLDVVIEEDPSAAIRTARGFFEAYYPGYEPTDEQLRRRGVYGPSPDVKAEIARYVDAGVDHVVARFASPDQFDQLERYADAVL